MSDDMEMAVEPGGETALSTQRVTEGLRALILSGELPPGSRIGQEALATRFAVSRIPVRGALARLESDGLVALKPNSGAWVAKLDLKECLEIYLIRERLEPLALAESVGRMTDAEIDALERLVEEMAAGTDTETFLRLDRQFHLAAYRSAEMHQLLPMIERFWNTTQHYRRAFTKLLGRERNWIIHAEHRLIMDAIRRRDAQGAGNLLMEHIRRTRLELVEHEDLFPPSEEPRRRRSRR
ncbi:MAG: GntR family transcriptional regulator [Sphingomonadales bacterium]